MRTVAHFPIGPDFRSRLSAFAAGYEEFALLDSCNNTVYGPNQFDFLLACGAVAVVTQDSGGGVADWYAAVSERADWLFGYLGYELNATTDNISPSPQQLFNTAPLRFFVPGIVIRVQNNIAMISVHEMACDTPENVFRKINDTPFETLTSAYNQSENIRLEPLISDYDYVNTVKKIQQHIIDGDIYELNYCQPFVARNTTIDPVAVFNRLCAVAKAPFSVLYRCGEQYLMCASPERFFSFDGKTMRSMPIKGTRKRGEDEASDKRLFADLESSEKDKAEHVMIVDLVRNDLTPLAETGSIQVTDLFGIYPFEQVWQMVSTVSARLRSDAKLSEALIRAFPMGSMTGAPKIRAMQLAAQYEPWQRGMYSGAFGYFDPDGRCDFNVIIRSLLYHTQTQLLAAYAGGAIVYDSIPEKELEECYVKLSGILRVLNGA